MFTRGYQGNILDLQGNFNKWLLVKTLAPSEPKIAGKWMFIPLELIIIGFDPPPNPKTSQSQFFPQFSFLAKAPQDLCLT